ncbi:MAG: TlpA family protein disulfide reductase [Solirubrobacteraceae bacterium]
MDRPDPDEPARAGADGPAREAGGTTPAEPPRYGRYVVLLVLLILVLITINTIATKPNGDAGVAPGQSLPPFAVPLALSNLEGDANVATPGNLGGAGKVPACTVRGPRVLNICQLYEQGPVVLVLFVDGGSCTDVLGDVQSLLGSFPTVRFAAVAIKGERDAVRRLIGKLHLTYPVGLDRDGALAALYKLATCPQISFALRGGVVQSKALLSTPSPAVLRARVAELVAAQARTAAG